jgi:hypothetical protein
VTEPRGQLNAWLPLSVLAALKHLAIDRGEKLGKVVERAVRRELARHERGKARRVKEGEGT